MNCRDFENVLIAIAHEQTVEPQARKLALSHSESCARCAKRLTEARIVVAGVRAVRQGIADRGAPARVEAALRNALRQRATNQASSRRVPAPIRRPHWSWRAIGAATALIMIAALLTSLFWQTSRPFEHSLNRVAVAAALLLNQPENRNVTGPRIASGGREHRRGEGIKRTPKVDQSRGPVRDVARDTKLADQAPPADEGTHALTDFILLTALSADTAMDSGQVIRVKVPLSTFFALGVVPFGAEHADKLVNAELVIGDDGVQRAIRLVK